MALKIQRLTMELSKIGEAHGGANKKKIPSPHTTPQCTTTVEKPHNTVDSLCCRWTPNTPVYRPVPLEKEDYLCKVQYYRPPDPRLWTGSCRSSLHTFTMFTVGKLAAGCRRGVTLSIGTQSVKALVDTCATIIIRNAKVYHEVSTQNFKPGLTVTSNIICGLGGRRLPTLSMTEIYVSSIGHIHALVVPDLGYTMILGSDELRRGGASIN